MKPWYYQAEKKNTTTLTVVTGDPKAGKQLVGAAIGDYINGLIVNCQNADKQIEQAEGKADIILISSCDTIEPWMEIWFERFGHPLFTIHIKRHDR